jgi:hypothetical protein
MKIPSPPTVTFGSRLVAPRNSTSCQRVDGGIILPPAALYCIESPECKKNRSLEKTNVLYRVGPNCETWPNTLNEISY